MDPVEEIVAARDCEQLVYEFCRLVDSGRRPEAAALFADQGTWRSGDHVVAGRQALDSYFTPLRPGGMLTRHLVTNVSVRVSGPDQAAGRSLVLWLSLATAGPDLPTGAAPVPCQARLGEYRDRFIRTPAGWRFLDRERSYVPLEATQ